MFRKRLKEKDGQRDGRMQGGSEGWGGRKRRSEGRAEGGSEIDMIGDREQVGREGWRDREGGR